MFIHFDNLVINIIRVKTLLTVLSTSVLSPRLIRYLSTSELPLEAAKCSNVSPSYDNKSKTLVPLKVNNEYFVKKKVWC